MAKTSILLLPDFVADSRMLEPQRAKFSNMLTPNWLPAQEKESLVEYAGRCVQTWVTETESVLDCQRPYALGGVFFGGMVALEMAFHLSCIGRAPDAVLLIGSCRTWNALPEAFGRNLVRLNLYPQAVRGWLLRRAQFGTAVKHERLTAEHRRLLTSMLEQQEWHWLLCALRMCALWRRDTSDVGRAPFQVHQIHGRLDKVIQPPSAKVATLLLDAGHFINLTHAAAVNNWIEAILLELEVNQTGARIAARGPQ